MRTLAVMMRMQFVWLVIIFAAVWSCGQPVIRRCSDGCSAGTTCDVPTGLCVVEVRTYDGGPSTSHCIDGKCKCGLGPPCQPGQWCSGAHCVCDVTSCPSGCCTKLAGGECKSQAFSSCGIGGSICLTCDVYYANGCTDGRCMCSGGAACGNGTRCDGTQCVCDSTTCPWGCCTQTVGGECKYGEARSATACGAGGGLCSSCDLDVADNCSNGGCMCGSGGACGKPTRCVSGRCQ